MNKVAYGFCTKDHEAYIFQIFIVKTTTFGTQETKIMEKYFNLIKKILLENLKNLLKHRNLHAQVIFAEEMFKVSIHLKFVFDLKVHFGPISTF